MLKSNCDSGSHCLKMVQDNSLRYFQQDSNLEIQFYVFYLHTFIPPASLFQWHKCTTVDPVALLE